MKVLSTTLSSKKAAPSVSVAYAVEIFSTPEVRGTTWDVPLTINGNVYTPLMPIRLGALSSAGGIYDGGVISLGNADHSLSSLFFNGGFKRKSITIYEVFPDGDNVEGEKIFSGAIDGHELKNEWIEMHLGAIVAQGVAQSPRRRVVPACGLVFKSEDCGYAGSSTHCPKNLAGCLSDRFAGFRFVPPKGTVFVWANQEIEVG